MTQDSTEPAALQGILFCRSCGHRMHRSALSCPGCGAREPEQAGISQRILLAALLCMFLGLLGAHRFYVGKPLTAILQILTLGGLGIWAMVDFVLIISSAFRNGQGQLLTDWL